MKIYENEQIDDLQFRGLKILQAPGSFRFGTDAVLLADFAGVGRGARVCDLGTGSGILPILLWGRHEFTHADAVELDPVMADRATRSMELNGLESTVTVWNRDLRTVRAFLPAGGYSTVVSNPPYQAASAGEASKDVFLAAARHETACTLEDVCQAAAYLLKTGGHFSVVYRAERMTELFDAMKRNKLEPKRLRPVQSKPDTPPYVVLVEAVREGKPGLRWQSTLILSDVGGMPTKELKRIYHQEEA